MGEEETEGDARLEEDTLGEEVALGLLEVDTEVRALELLEDTPEARGVRVLKSEGLCVADTEGEMEGSLVIHIVVLGLTVCVELALPPPPPTAKGALEAVSVEERLGLPLALGLGEPPGETVPEGGAEPAAVRDMEGCKTEATGDTVSVALVPGEAVLEEKGVVGAVLGLRLMEGLCEGVGERETPPALPGVAVCRGEAVRDALALGEAEREGLGEGLGERRGDTETEGVALPKRETTGEELEDEELT